MSQASAPKAAVQVPQIVGDKTNMYVVFDPQAGSIYTFDAKANAFGVPRLVAQPQPASKPDQPEDGAEFHPLGAAPAPALQGIAGNAVSGVAYFNGKQVSYLADIGNLKAQWKTLPEAPFDITGICGDLINGIVIQNGDMLSQITDVVNSPVWQSTAVSPRIPIKGIVGDGSNGLVVFRDLAQDLTKFDGDDKKFVPKVYKFTGKPYSAAQPTMEPPILIDLLAGDGVNGYVAFGENQLYLLDSAKGAWSKSGTLNFELKAIVGNSKDGVLALIGSENFLVASTDLKAWSLLQTLPLLPAAALAKPKT